MLSTSGVLEEGPVLCPEVEGEGSRAERAGQQIEAFGYWTLQDVFYYSKFQFDCRNKTKGDFQEEGIYFSSHIQLIIH